MTRKELIEWFEADPLDFLDGFDITPEYIVDLLETNHCLCFLDEEERVDEEEEEGWPYPDQDKDPED